MRVAIGSDHGGYELKEEVKKYLTNQCIDYIDVGTNSTKSVDYPDFGKKVGEHVTLKNYNFGIVICGSGIGISIAANKVKGVRAALVYNEDTAKLAKEHNNANVIALGGRITETDEAIKIIKAFMNATFENRHQKRLDLIKKIEEDI
jgi:ribose 5-phosphate isomerase B